MESLERVLEIDTQDPADLIGPYRKESFGCDSLEVKQEVKAFLERNNFNNALKEADPTTISGRRIIGEFFCGKGIEYIDLLSKDDSGKVMLSVLLGSGEEEKIVGGRIRRFGKEAFFYLGPVETDFWLGKAILGVLERVVDFLNQDCWRILQSSRKERSEQQIWSARIPLNQPPFDSLSILSSLVGYGLGRYPHRFNNIYDSPSGKGILGLFPTAYTADFGVYLGIDIDSQREREEDLLVMPIESQENFFADYPLGYFWSPDWKKYFGSFK